MRDPLYDITGHPLLSDKYNKLKDDDEKTAQNYVAELLLNLREPVYTGDDADELGHAIVRQINFQMEQGITPEVLRSVSNAHPGNTTQYRDRWVEPGAWAIVARVTGVQQVRFVPPGFGV
jgi:hypothetical protein